MKHVLSTGKIAKKLEFLPGWSLRNRSIRRIFSFDGFPQSIDFVRKIAINSEKINHHPDINIRFDKVTLSLTSHDAGGITAKDFSLAEQCDVVYDQMLDV
jgi:4a-hydroxytetrahydrobiopterin dehydratase